MSEPTLRAPLVRLDSFDPRRGARSFRFSGFLRVVQAARLEEVVPVLAEVEAAVSGGLHAAGFVAYEAAPALDPTLAAHPPAAGLPLAWFALYAEREEVSAPEGEEDETGEDEPGFSLGEWEPSVTEDGYAASVERVREWIAAGDTYQANFTFRLRAAFSGDALALYERLCRAQRSAFCAYLEVGDLAVVSASPELFFRREGGSLELRPMKGTAPRGRWTAEDDAQAAALLASPKERAENLMIVDLLRNDAGRVAEFGSVHVPRLFETETYETVHQLTSTVRARLRPGTELVDLFRALFPCGSVTGAPKVRTSQIIAELEDSPRGVYTGAIGVVSPGEAAFSVAIRTLVIDRARGRAELGVGSGVTHDSRPAAEYRECLDKAAFARRAPHRFRLLETMRWEPGTGFFLLDGHLERMRESARYFGFAFAEDEVRRRLAEAVAEAAGESGGALRVRLLLSRGGHIAVETYPLAPDGVADGDTAPLRVALSAEPVDSREPLLYHKTTRRAPYDRRRAARPDCDDVLLINERGEVCEATLANVVAVIGGGRWTPPLESGLLPGVLRAALLRRGEVRERVLRPADLASAEEIYLVSSLRGWRRAVLVP